MGLNLDLAELRRRMGSGSPEEIFTACKSYCPTLNNYDEAMVWVWTIADQLFQRSRPRAASLLLYPLDVFNPRPPSVARIIKAIEENAKVIILGAGSQGKTYVSTWFLFMEWLSDPEATACRILSVTGGHALDQAFSNMQKLYSGSILPLPGVSQKGYIAISTTDRHASLSVIAVQKGEVSPQVLRGFHPVPRPVPHPKYGPLSRDRILLDEAVMVPAQIWVGVSNVLGNLSGTETVKVIAVANPTDPTCPLAHLSAPEKGWGKVDIDEDVEWVSKEDWKVIRIDAATSPNVVAKKVIDQGYMTYEGYMEYVRKGEHNADYEAFARAIFPRSGTPDALIPLSWMDNFKGRFRWDEAPVTVAGVDLAYTGDDAIMVIGRYGKASAWYPEGSTDEIKLDIPGQYVLQLDTWITLKGESRSGARYEEIQVLVKRFGVAYEFLTLDASGNGRGTVDAFIENGYRVREVVWGAAASHKKILEHDTLYADERYTDNTSEMYHAGATWIEGGFMKAAPHTDTDRATRELTGRRKKPSSRIGPPPHNEPLEGIEKKEDFKKRQLKQQSPDLADAIVMCLHGCRLGGETLLKTIKRKNLRLAPPPDDSASNNLNFIDFSD